MQWFSLFQYDFKLGIVLNKNILILYCVFLVNGPTK